MQLVGKRILVTGGAGFIGSHLVDSLRCLRDGVGARCSMLRVLDDFSTGHNENLAHLEGVEIVRGDVRDAGLLDDVLHDIDVVFHLACRGLRHSIGNPKENAEVNGFGTLSVLEAARCAGVERLVHVSSSEVYGTALSAPMDENHPCLPETVYGAGKLAGEGYARAFFRTYGLPTVVVRPFNNFGPRSHFEGDSGEVIPRFCVWALCGQPPVIFGDGLQTRDFIYVEETAHWLCRIAECDDLVGRTINLGSGRETSIRELAEIICRRAGRPDLAAEHLPPRPGDVRRHLAGTALARSVLGFETRVSVEEGIARLLDYLKALPESPEQLAALMDKANWKLQPVACPQR